MSQQELATLSSLTPARIRKLEPNTRQQWFADPEVEGLYVLVTPAGAKRWYYRYRIGARQRWASIGDALTVSRKKALDRLKALAGQVASGKDPVGEKQAARAESKRAKRRTLRAFLDDEYTPWVKSERRTGDEIVKRIERNFEWLLDRPMDKITPIEVERWRRDKHEAGRTPGTTNRDLSCLRECLRKAVAWGVISTSPLEDVKRRKVDKAPPIHTLSVDEEKALRDALRARDAKMRAQRASANQWREARDYDLYDDYGAYVDHLEPIVLLALATGMRRGELLRLRWEDVRADEVRVRASNAKSGTTRDVPLNSAARAIFKRLARASEWVFPGSDPEQPTTTIKTSWTAIKKAAGIPHVRFHWLRHTVASRLIRHADIRTVAAILGHVDIATTARYLHTDKAAKRAAVEAL